MSFVDWLPDEVLHVVCNHVYEPRDRARLRMSASRWAMVCENTHVHVVTDKARWIAVDAQDVASRVISGLFQAPEQLLTLTLASATILVIRGHDLGNRLLITKDGWRSKSRVMSDAALSALVRQIMTASKGTAVRLPCVQGTNVVVSSVVQARLERATNSGSKKLICSAMRG